MASATLTSPHSAARTFTANEVADLFGVNFNTVVAWLKAGELIGFSASKSATSGKPRYRITAEDLERFKLSRSVAQPPSAPAARRRRSAASGVTQFFK